MRVMILALTVAVILAPIAGATAVPAAAHGAVPEPTADARSGMDATTLATSLSSSTNVSLTAYALDDSIQAGSNATILFSVDNHKDNATVAVALTNVPESWTKDVVDDDGASSIVNASTAHLLRYPDTSEGTTLAPTLNAYVPSDAPSGSYTLTAIASVGDGETRTNITIDVSGGTTTSSSGPTIGGDGGGGGEWFVEPCGYEDYRTQDATPSVWEPYHLDGLLNNGSLGGNFNGELDATEISDGLNRYSECSYTDMTVIDISRALGVALRDEQVTYPDSDGDGLTDREEAAIEEADSATRIYKYVYDDNPDGDQFTDYNDARRGIEDMPPEVNISSGDYKDELSVVATDDAGLSLISLHEKGTSDYTQRPVSGSSADESFSSLNLGTEYWVNVSDVNGNEYVILLAVQSDGSAEIRRAGTVVFAASVGSPVIGDELIGAGVVLGALALAAVALTLS